MLEVFTSFAHKESNAAAFSGCINEHARSLASRGRCLTAQSCVLRAAHSYFQSRLAVVMKNMIAHCQHSEHRTGDQGSTTALLLYKISLHPTTTHSPSLHSSHTVMAYPTHLLMNQYAATNSFKLEGTLKFSFPVGAKA